MWHMVPFMEADRNTARQAIAAEVRAEIARQGLTAATVASRSDMTTTTMSRKLAGRVDFTLTELCRVAESLGIKASDLVARAEGIAA